MSRAFASILVLYYCLVVASAQQFTQTISTGSDNATVDFELFPIRSSNFGVLVEQANGSFTPYAAPSPRTYLGTVRGRPGAMASGLLKPNGTLLCRISFENGIEWSSTGGVASVRGSTNWKAQWPTSLVPPTNGNSTLYIAEVGVDASYAAYVAAGSNVSNAIDMVEFSIMAANVPFLRDASILHKVGKVVIRGSQSRDPYSSTSTKVLLNTVRKLWNGVLSTVVGKTHHLGLVSRPGAGGGLAWVGTVATSKNAYSANGAGPSGDFSVIWRHEAGHNWGANHNEGGGRPEGPTIMSGNKLSRFSSSELSKILRHQSKVPRLANASMVIPRPPRANMNAAIIPSKQPLHLDVLANDKDADIQGLKLISVQNPSPMDSTTRISGRDQIVYTPSAVAALSGDSFTYRIQNVEGRTSTGYVIVRPDALVGWWKMDDNSGLTVRDSSGNGATGSITGSTSWNQGLVFKGAGMLSLRTNPSLRGTTSFSISAWVRVASNATTNAVIIQQRSPPSSTTNGYNGVYKLYLANGAKPHFVVFGDGEYQFDFTASTAINDGQWHHIVAMRNDTEGRIYIDGKLSASASGQVKNLDGNIPVFMGCDARDNTSFLTGYLMGVRIYSRAIGSDEISYLSTRPEALAGWWKMNEKTGLSVQDFSGNMATGTISGSATWDQDGGLIFGGAGGVSFGTRPSLSGKTSFSIHAWVKVPTSAASIGVIIQQRSPPSSTTSGYNGEYQLYLTSGAKPRFMLFGGGGYQFDLTASTAINDGRWHHIVAMRDGIEGRIYIDGKLSAFASGQVRNLDGNIPVFMGWDARNKNRFLTGSVKGIKIYNQAVVTQDQSSTILLAAA